MKPFVPLSALLKALPKLPSYEECKSDHWSIVFSISPHVEFHFEKNEVFKEWCLVKVTMKESQETTAQPFAASLELELKPSSSIYDLLELLEQAGEDPELDKVGHEIAQLSGEEVQQNVDSFLNAIHPPNPNAG